MGGFSLRWSFCPTLPYPFLYSHIIVVVPSFILAINHGFNNLFLLDYYIVHISKIFELIMALNILFCADVPLSNYSLGAQLGCGLAVHTIYFALPIFAISTRKIIEIAATRWHVLKLKCPKFNFSWSSAPDPA